MAKTFEEWLSQNLNINNSDDALAFINEAIELEKKQSQKYGRCSGIENPLERVKERIVTKVVEDVVLGAKDDKNLIKTDDTKESETVNRKIQCKHVK